MIRRALSFDALSQRHGSRYKWLLLITVATGTIAGVLATSAFNVAVTALSQQFGLGHDQVQWAVTGFMAAMTLSMLPTSWLLDRIGFRRLFLAAVAVLTVASVAGSLAQSFAEVVLARVLQGPRPASCSPWARWWCCACSRRTCRAGPRACSRWGWSSPRRWRRPSAACWWTISAGPPSSCSTRPSAWPPWPWAPGCCRPRGPRHPFDWTGALLLSLATLAVVDGVTRLHRDGVLSAGTAAHGCSPC
jgi:hypothetical protein